MHCRCFIPWCLSTIAYSCLRWYGFHLAVLALFEFASEALVEPAILYTVVGLLFAMKSLCGKWYCGPIPTRHRASTRVFRARYIRHILFSHTVYEGNCSPSTWKLLYLYTTICHGINCLTFAMLLPRKLGYSVALVGLFRAHSVPFIFQAQAGIFSQTMH